MAPPSQWLIAVDPGTTNLGIAAFCDGVLVAADYLNRPTAADVRRWGDKYCTRATWVREEMTFYPQKKASWPNLRAIEDMCSAIGYFDEKWKARAWKAGLPKNVHHPRLEPFLTPEEAAIWDSVNSDGRDAIGIGLFALGRTARGGLPPGPHGRGEDSACK